MLIIPELETVVIFVPRTGSGSLRRALQKKYQKSMMLYRHMEVDGIPRGYDRWRKVGVVRHPLNRMWSLYKFCKVIDGPQHNPAWIKKLRASVDRPFHDWLINNDVPFTTPYDAAGEDNGYYPLYNNNNTIAENRKSQFLYLRPDLGTEIWKYDDLNGLANELGVKLGRENPTPHEEPQLLSNAAVDYANEVFYWDFQNFNGVE